MIKKLKLKIKKKFTSKLKLTEFLKYSDNLISEN